MNSLHEGEFQAEKIGDLLHIVLINIHTLSDLLNMVQPMTEFVKEFTAVMKGSDVMNSVNIWLDSLQQSSGLVKLAGTAWAQVKAPRLQRKTGRGNLPGHCHLDFTKVKPVGPFAMIKQYQRPQSPVGPRLSVHDAADDRHRSAGLPER